LNVIWYFPTSISPADTYRPTSATGVGSAPKTVESVVPDLCA
jgi:hypothetical protein